MTTTTTAISVNHVSILDELVVFVPDMLFFGGSTSLTAEDLGITSTNLPKEIVALGTKQIVDTELLKGFKTTRAAIIRRAKREGASFLNGFAMSKDAGKRFLDDVNPTLELLREQVQQFIDGYSDHVEAWANAHPEWSDTIRASAPSLATVKNRFRIKMSCVQVSPPGDDLGDGNLSSEVSSIAEQVLIDIAATVKQIWKDRGYGCQNIKGTLLKVIEKSRSLSFINADLSVLANLVEEISSSLPKTGKIEGSDYLKLKGLMDMLMQPNSVLNHLKKGDFAQIENEPEPELNASALPSININVLPSIDTNSMEIDIVDDDDDIDTDIFVSDSVDSQDTRSAWSW